MAGEGQILLAESGGHGRELGLVQVADREPAQVQLVQPGAAAYRAVGCDVQNLAADGQYARGLRPTTLCAVHFILDSARADRLRRQWADAGTGIPLELTGCPDRRLAHATARMVSSLAAAPGTHVTVVLPRRSYPPLARRLLHDHTADRIARVVSRVPGVAATIIPSDVRHRVKMARAPRAAPATPAGNTVLACEVADSTGEFTAVFYCSASRRR